MFIKRGEHPSLFFIILHSSSQLCAHIENIPFDLNFLLFLLFSSTSVESALIQLGLGLRTVTYQTLPYRTVHSQYT